LGTDELTVTTAEAVKLYAVDTAPIATVGGVDIEGSADGSAIAAVPRSTDEVYGLSDRGPNVDGRTDDEKVLPVPDFQPRIDEYKLSDGSATIQKTIGLTGTDGAPLRGLVDPQANTGETLVDINGKPLPTSDHGLDTEGLVALPASTLVEIMQSALKTRGWKALRSRWRSLASSPSTWPPRPSANTRTHWPIRRRPRSRSPRSPR
jgi:hypothetical protein